MRIQRTENLSFGRKFNSAEMKVYSESVNKGLKLLDKQVDIIIHNVSAPSVPAEDVGIGSLFSRTTAEKLIPFLKQHAVKGIQMEPINMRKLGDQSPYAPESSAKNILMIPLEKLASDEYKNLLSQKTFQQIVANRPKGNKTDYKYVNKQFEIALKEAYENFKKGDFLKKEFADFKKEKGEYLEKAAIFRLLDQQYKKDWTKWKGIDKNLYAPKNAKQAEVAAERIKELKSEYSDEIDFFLFNQMILERENKASNKLAHKTGIKMIGDSPVASPSADEWINQNLFLKGKALGCGPDAFSKDGQRWGFRYFDPHKIFNADGTLGEAGEVLKKKYEEYFASFPGGLRIDHIIGLVDPFIYTVGEKMMSHNSGRLYSQAKYKKSEDQYDWLLTKIVFPAAEKFGITKKDIICEDLGEPNFPTQKVMKDLDLSGIAVTQFDYRGADTPKKNLIMLGSHDNISFLEYVKNLFANKDTKHFLHKTGLLGHDIAPKDASHEQRTEIINSLREDPVKFIAASFAELFTSPARRIQIFFADFFGMAETYNKPGTTKGNWALRISENFEDDYYKAVAEGKAPNFAASIATALRQRGLDKENAELIKDLDNSAKILAE